MLPDVNKYTEFESEVRLAWHLQNWWVYADLRFDVFYRFWFWGRRQEALAFTQVIGDSLKSHWATVENDWNIIEK